MDSIGQNDGLLEYISKRPQSTPQEISERRKRLAEKLKNDPEFQKKIHRIAMQICQSPGVQALQKHAAEWQRQAEWASRYSHIYSSLPKYAEIQAQIGNIISNLPISPQTQEFTPSTINAITRAYDAIGNASLSGSLEEYKQNIETAIEAAVDFSNSDSENDISSHDNPLREQLTELKNTADSSSEDDLADLQENAADMKFGIDLAIKEKVSNIEVILSNFLTEFQKIAKQNSKSSSIWAWASCILSVVAISVAVWSEYSDKTGELIEVVKKSHPWSEQQISAEDAKNARVAFQSITGALQKNVQLEKDNIQLRQETDRLQADLKKAQDDLAELQNKYNADKVAWIREKQKLYAEITALKKQIEELKTELAKRPLPQSNSILEGKNE
jgi:hypothetical protein